MTIVCFNMHAAGSSVNSAFFEEIRTSEHQLRWNISNKPKDGSDIHRFSNSHVHCLNP